MTVSQRVTHSISMHQNGGSAEYIFVMIILRGLVCSEKCESNSYFYVKHDLAFAFLHETGLHFFSVSVRVVFLKFFVRSIILHEKLFSEEA